MNHAFSPLLMHIARYTFKPQITKKGARSSPSPAIRQSYHQAQYPPQKHKSPSPNKPSIRFLGVYEEGQDNHVRAVRQSRGTALRD